MAEAWKPLTELVKDVQSGTTTAMELVERSLKAIEEAKEYKAIISTLETRALERAKSIDNKIAQGDKIGRLAGVPFIAKDNFLVFGTETTAASNMLAGFEPPYQSSAIEMLEAEGAICVAKANLDAFGHGASTENSDFMMTKNPHDLSRVPGGSSGGSAAAVALNLAPFALGTDTGGSNRLPASYCGVIGYKPTYGLVSRNGVVAMASSTDTIGVLAPNTETVAEVLDVMSGKDAYDSTTIDRDNAPYTDHTESLQGKTIGVIKEHMSDDVRPEVRQVIQDTVAKIKKAGANIKEVSLPSSDLALACYYILCPAEISSNLSRYDGQRYGHSSVEAKNLEESYELSRSQGFGDEAKRRIMIGTYVLSSGYYDAYYKNAQKLRTKIIAEYEEVFKDVDLLAGPTVADIAFKAGAKEDPLAMYLIDIMTVSASLVGVPAISIPAGKIDGMPVGLQLSGPQRSDRMLLSVSKQIEEIMS